MLMWQFPRRRKSYYNNAYYRKPKRVSRISPWWLLLALPVSLIAIELFLRAFAGLTGKSGDGAGESPLAHAYRLQFLTEDKKPITGLADGGDLVVYRSAATSYQLLSNQRSPFWQINAQGFRDRDPLPLAKPKNEIRIFLLGSSTAFGQNSQNNDETIAHQLETRLKQRISLQTSTPEKFRPDVFPFFKPSREKLLVLPAKIRNGQYRVINAAVPGYASGNELAQLALQILPYQPDLIVILDGYADLILPSKNQQTDIPQIDRFLEDATAHFQASLGKSFSQWIDHSYLLQALSKPQANLTEQTLAVNPQGKSLAQALPQDEAELKRRVVRYRQNQQQLLQLCQKIGIPVMIALQPEITGLPPERLSPQEKALREQLGKAYTQRVPKAYSQLIQASQQLAKSAPQAVKVLDFYKLPPTLPKPTFSDAIHLTKQGNAAIAERLYQAIAGWEKMQIIPANFYLKENKK